MAEVVNSKGSAGEEPDSSGTLSDAQADLRAPSAGGVERDGPSDNVTAPATPRPRETPARFVNVWSWTARKYRIRTVVLLLLNLVLFCGLCVFTHWLHVAQPFEFTLASYLEPLKFWGEQTQNLNDFVLYPVSVEQNHMHGVVLGLLLASMVAVPISVAILYRFPFAMPFVAAVVLFAHMPWMALTLVACCMLAAVKPFRLSFRFGAALVGMLPVILYLYLATRGTPSQIGTYASPDQKLLVAAPWVLAILAACAMLATILAISRVVNYRPGAVAPVTAVMFATPAILFQAYVGVDEVSYRVLEAEYGPRARRFAVGDVTDQFSVLCRARLDELPKQEWLGAVVRGPEHLIALHRQFTNQLLRDFMTDRRAADQACWQFIADHPDSRYVPSVLHIQGWALDLRLDARKLELANLPLAPLRREFYSDYPHVQSEEPWLALLTGYPDSPLSIAARLRLAQLRLRRGELTQALPLLADLHARAAAPPATQSSTQPVGRPWLRTADPESSLAFDPQPYWREADRWYELVLANRDDPKYGSAPLQELAAVDPHRPSYRRQLLRLAGRYRDALLYDNLVVLWAAGETDREQRAARLAACIRSFPAGDALAEAMFRLAELEMQSRGENQEQRRQAGIDRMGTVVERFGNTCWGRKAAERLRILQPPAEPAPVAVPP